MDLGSCLVGYQYPLEDIPFHLWCGMSWSYWEREGCWEGVERVVPEDDQLEDSQVRACQRRNVRSVWCGDVCCVSTLLACRVKREADRYFNVAGDIPSSMNLTYTTYTDATTDTTSLPIST